MEEIMDLLKTISKSRARPRYSRHSLLAEESRLVRAINDLSDQHLKIEHVPEAARRAQYVLRRITRLKIQLDCVRSIAREFRPRVDLEKTIS